MFTTTVFSRKGGVGKTSIAILAASFLAAAGRRVLLLDLDPQSSLTAFYARQAEVSPAMAGSPEIMKPFYLSRDAIRHIHPHLSLIPARGDLFEDDALAHPERPGFYLEQLDREFDHCIIDTSGNWTALSRSAILASDLVLVPALVTIDDLENALWTCTVTEGMNRKARVLLNQVAHLKQEEENLFLFHADLKYRLLQNSLPRTNLVRNFTDRGEAITEGKDRQDFLQALGDFVREAMDEEAFTDRVDPV